MYADYFHISPGKEAEGNFGRFRAGHVKMTAAYDTEFVEKLCLLAEKRNLPAGRASAGNIKAVPSLENSTPH